MKNLRVLRSCVKALMGSSNRAMLRANLEFLIDMFIHHPPDHVRLAFDRKEAKLKGRAS